MKFNEEKAFEYLKENDVIDGDCFNTINWFINTRLKEVKPKEMSISEIEKELGYEIKIVNK